ncbi:hypothetical protein D3C71_1431640 [compost metagenome]
MLLAQRQWRHRIDFVQRAVHPHAHEALRAQLVEHLGVLALALADDRGQQHVALLRVQGEHVVDHLADRLRFQRVAVVGAARAAHAGVQQAQVVVDLGDRAHGGARVVRGRLLLDRDGRGQALDVVQVRLLHHAQELPGIGRQRLHVTALAFGVDGVEGQRRLARAGQAGDDNQLVAGQVEIDVLEIVRPRAADADEIHRHGGSVVRLWPGGPASGWGKRRRQSVSLPSLGFGGNRRLCQPHVSPPETCRAAYLNRIQPQGRQSRG